MWRQPQLFNLRMAPTNWNSHNVVVYS